MPPPADDGREAATPRHLVIRRGQKGRFRFTFLTDHGAIRGEVFVGPGPRDAQLVEARTRVERLAASLLDEMEGGHDSRQEPQ